MVHLSKKIIAICGAVLLSASAASAASVSLVQAPPPPAEFTVGDTFSLTLAGIGLPAFDGFQIDVTYDRDLVSYQGATFNPTFIITADQLANAQAAEAGGSGVYTLGNITAGTFTPLGGAVDVVTLNFEALAEGIADITVSPFLSFGNPAMFTNLGRVVFEGDIVTSSILIGEDDIGTTPIPLPATAWLLGAGLLGLFGSRKVMHQG